MQLWRKRQEKGPDTNVRWLVGNLKVKGTRDCILRLQVFGWWQQIDQIRQIRTFPFSQHANLKIWQHMFEKLLLPIWPHIFSSYR